MERRNPVLRCGIRVRTRLEELISHSNIRMKNGEVQERHPMGTIGVSYGLVNDFLRWVVILDKNLSLMKLL